MGVVGVVGLVERVHQVLRRLRRDVVFLGRRGHDVEDGGDGDGAGVTGEPWDVLLWRTGPCAGGLWLRLMSRSRSRSACSRLRWPGG